MEKYVNLIKKFSSLITSIAAAYYFVLITVGDVMYSVLFRFKLGFLAWFVYLFVGLVGIYKLIETFKPDLLEKCKLCNKDKK